MRRRRFLLTAGALLAAPLARAQRAQKVHRIGVLWPVFDDPVLQAFREGLRDLGYVEGRNLAIEYRYAHGRDELLPGFAAELVRPNVAVIVTWGVTPGLVAKNTTATIPIVNGSMSDPVAAGLAESLAKPGGNVTGLTSRSPEVARKRLELMMEVVPRLARLAVLTTAGKTATFATKEIELEARSLGVAVQAIEVRGPDDLEPAFAAFAKERADALIVAPDLMFQADLSRLVGLAATHRLPASYYLSDFVEAGGLISYMSSMKEQFRRAAVYVDKILKGAKPSELPIEAPTKFELVVNVRTAKAMGLVIPQSVLLRADRVIE